MKTLAMREHDCLSIVLLYNFHVTAILPDRPFVHALNADLGLIFVSVPATARNVKREEFD